jgi:hypothetical protein
LWQHVLDFFVADEDLVDGVSSVLQGNVIAIDVGRKEDFWVPSEALAGGKVGNQTRRAVRVADVNNSAFFFGESGAQEAWTAIMRRFAALAGGRRGG